MPKMKSLASAQRAAQARPQGSRPAMQRTVREGCIASLRRALQNKLGARWTRELVHLARGPGLAENTTVGEL